MSRLLFAPLINLCVSCVFLKRLQQTLIPTKEIASSGQIGAVGDCIEVVLTVAARWDSLVLPTPFVISQFLQIL